MPHETSDHSNPLPDPIAPNSSDSSNPKHDSEFETTHWSLVLAAGHRGSSDAHIALQKLCQRYWSPLYGYVRRRGIDRHNAHDLTQAFFARILEKNYIAEADPTRGRFRTFLLTSFQHFLSNEWAAEKAQRRGGRKLTLSLDFEREDSMYLIEPTGGRTPEQLYERQWAITLLNRVMERLELEMGQAGKRLQFERLKDFIVAANESTYLDTAAALGMTAAATRMAASRMRQRYRELLRDEIAQTVSGPDEVEDEIRHLFAAVGT